MGKVEENKQHKFESLVRHSYDLFINNGVEHTTISDITKAAGIAKGTFYLYFKDKYELRDFLIAHTASELFQRAITEMKTQTFDGIESEIIFLIQYILEDLSKDKTKLFFIYKNLGDGLFQQATTSSFEKVHLNVEMLCQMLNNNRYGTKINEPEIMLFLLTELASSACYSTLLHNYPMSFEELEPHLIRSLQAIIRTHISTN